MLGNLLKFIAPHIAKRVLAALGIGIISYSGISLIISNVTQQINSHLGQTNGSVLQMVTLFGAIDSMSIILGAIATRVTLLSLKKWGIL